MTLSLRIERNACRQVREKRPFALALKMYDNGKWAKTAEGRKAIDFALLCVMGLEEDRGKEGYIII